MEAAVLPPAAAPVSVGKYELGRLLGRGSFAKVYYARAVTSGAAVAVKVIDKAAVPSSVRPRLLREISVMRLLHHPNIVRLHEVMATRSKIFLVMEIAGGGDLRSLLFRRRRLPEPVAARIFQQLVSAVCFCHAHGVAHRDLKLQNLLIDDAGDLKVADFGLSFLSEERGGNGISVLHTACGPPGYAAPEVLRERGYDGARADAWSCGVILYAMLAGHLPFDGANLALAYHKMNKRDYNFPAWFSPAATRVISGLLDPNIETRLPLAVLQKELTGGDGEAAGGGGAEGSSPCKAEVGPVNAFQIIALSPCLDLSVLFRQGKKTTAAAEALKILLGRVTGGGDRAGSGATALT